MSIERLDLDLLRILHLVLTEQSVARAARRLHVTPSAVSNGLARLRDALGDPLVTRKGRGVVPTPRAAELAPVLARTLGDLDAAVFAARFDPATCDRRFTLAIADGGQLAYVPDLARRLRRELPRAQLRVIGIESLVALGDLGSPEIDVHVGIRWQAPGIHHEPLLDERAVLIAGRRHPVTRGRPSARTLDELRHVGVEMLPGRGVRDAVGETYRKAGRRRDVVMTVPTFTAAAWAVAATDLVATVPAPLARAFAARLGVALVGGPVPTHAVALGLSWHERTHADLASMAFRALVRASVLDARPGRAV